MSAQLYWRERLAARQPFFSEALRVEGRTYRAKPNDTWPIAVLKSTMYMDYLEWFEKKFIVPYRAIPFYIDDPRRLPEADDEFLFQVQMSQWLYVFGRDNQTRAYKVKTSVNTQQQWVNVKKKKNFIRLADWEVHVAQFELTTGIKLGGREYDRAGFIACAREMYSRKMFTVV